MEPTQIALFAQDGALEMIEIWTVSKFMEGDASHTLYGESYTCGAAKVPEILDIDCVLSGSYSNKEK